MISRILLYMLLCPVEQLFGGIRNKKTKQKIHVSGLVQRILTHTDTLLFASDLHCDSICHKVQSSMLH